MNILELHTSKSGLLRCARNDESRHARHCEPEGRGNPLSSGGLQVQVLTGGFSLIELLISLIVISLITTAFAPVLTKRLKNQNATISNGARVEDCLKFDNRCLLCMSGKCSLCSTQINLEEGKYVDASISCDIKNCDTGCTKCNSTECASCKNGYGYDSTTKKCTKCAAGTYSTGGTSLCTPCAANYISSEGAASCIPCSAGSYSLAGSASCSACPANCSTCSSSTTCTSCVSDYTLINDQCKETKGCLAIGNICVAKYNAGDTYIGGLKIPDGIGVTKKMITASASAGGHHTNAYCWIGNGQNATSSKCNADNGGYSGCTRTVCTWSAADKICKYHGWRLPTQSEIAQFASYSIGKGTAGLQLCDRYSGYSSAQCYDVNRCFEANDGYCNPYDVWGSEVLNSGAYHYNLNLGAWKGSYTIYQSYGFSVRCVRDL